MKMETARLLIRHMNEADEDPFVRGIADPFLRTAYGFPAEMDDTVPPQIFRHFLGLANAFALVEKGRGEMIGYLLDTAPELPEDVRILGFDDAPESRISRPALSTVHIHTQVMAFSAVQLLVSRMKEPSLDYRTIHTQTDLILRESTVF